MADRARPARRDHRGRSQAQVRRPPSSYQSLSPKDKAAADKTQAIVEDSIGRTARTHRIGYISRKQIGNARWPLTVAQGIVRCEQGSVIFHANGVDYAVNGTALDAHPELLPINPIWRKQSDPGLGLRVDISPIVDKGLKLC